MDDMAEKIRSLLNDEESMQQIKELAEMFGNDISQSGSAGSEQSDPAGDMFSGIADMISPAVIMQLMDVFSREDDCCGLIAALRPFLSEERRRKADSAVKMLKLYNAYVALKEQGLLNNLL